MLPRTTTTPWEPWIAVFAASAAGSARSNLSKFRADTSLPDDTRSIRLLLVLLAYCEYLWIPLPITWLERYASSLDDTIRGVFSIDLHALFPIPRPESCVPGCDGL